MNARAIDEAGARLARQRRRAREAAALALLFGALAAAAIPAGAGLSVPLGAGSALAAFVAVHTALSRKLEVGLLALDPDAYAIPEVRRFGANIAGVEERARLADWISAIVRDPDKPGTYHLPERVRGHARELESLARDLGSPALSVQPVSAVAARRLLTNAVESPLYNPEVPTEDLTAALFRIRQGFRGGD